MAVDKTTFASSGTTNPAGEAEEITPADVDLTQYSRAIYVGGDGDLAVRMAGKENDVTFTAVPAGSLLPIRVLRVRAATTATSIVVLYQREDIMRFRLWEKFKAWRRNEVLLDGVSRGRCFVKKAELATNNAKQSTGKATAKLVGIKVIRKDGTEEVIKHG